MCQLYCQPIALSQLLINMWKPKQKQNSQEGHFHQISHLVGNEPMPEN